MVLIAGSMAILPQNVISLLTSGVASAVFMLAIGFGLGHLVQGVGNLVEWCFWKPWRGRPTDWLRLDDQRCFDRGWRGKILYCFGIVPDHEVESKEWDGYVRRIIEAVTGPADGHRRLLVFNGNYGLFRGLATVFLLLIPINLVFGSINWIQIGLLLMLTCISFFRMYRFGIYYAKTLFASFINMKEHVIG